MYLFWTNVYNAWNIELYRNVNLTFQGCCFFFHQLILRTLNVIHERNLTWILLKHSIFNVKFSIGPLGSITATEVLWHQYDRINTSKAESGPTAASHSQCSTFHVLLRFTTISHKPTASQTEKKIMESTCCYRVFPQLQWNISNATFDERLKFNRLKRGKRCLDCVTWAACKGPFNSDIQVEIIAAWLHGFGFLWCTYLIVSMEGKLKSLLGRDLQCVWYNEMICSFMSLQNNWVVTTIFHANIFMYFSMSEHLNWFYKNICN